MYASSIAYDDFLNLSITVDCFGLAICGGIEPLANWKFELACYCSNTLATTKLMQTKAHNLVLNGQAVQHKARPCGQTGEQKMMIFNGSMIPSTNWMIVQVLPNIKAANLAMSSQCWNLRISQNILLFTAKLVEVEVEKGKDR